MTTSTCVFPDIHVQYGVSVGDSSSHVLNWGKFPEELKLPCLSLADLTWSQAASRGPGRGQCLATVEPMVVVSKEAE